MATSPIVEHAIVTGFIHTMQWIARSRMLRYKIVKPNTEIRVAFSALLRIDDNGRYLLVRNLHRPETFCPFGGVFKYYQEAQDRLDSWCFRQQNLGPGKDMAHDIRGFIPRRHLLDIVKWYNSANGHEAPNECLIRELREEIGEINLLSQAKIPSTLHFHCIRNVEEGPSCVPAMGYKQFRVFHVCELVRNSNKIESFVRRLFKLAQGNKDLLIADAEEILEGRSRDGRAIGSTTCYLIRGKRVRQDDPPIVRM